MFNRTHFKKFYRAKTQRKISSYFSELGVLCVFAGLIFFRFGNSKTRKFQIRLVSFFPKTLQRSGEF